MKTKSLLFSLLSLLLFSLSCTKKTNPEVEKAIVTKTVQELYEAYEKEDMALMEKIMAQDEDMVNFGTEITEHEVGWIIWKSNHQAQWEVIDMSKITSKDLTVFMNETANTAWFSDITDWFLIIQNEAINLNTIRITGVLEKRGNQWKIVQVHASVPQEKTESNNR